MEHEFEPTPPSPLVKAGAGVAAALLIAILAHAVGFVDLAAPFGGGEDGRVDVEVEGDDPTTSVPESLAFDEDDTGDATRPTVVERIELNPDEATTTTTTSTTTTSIVASTTSDVVGNAGDDGGSADDDGDGNEGLDGEDSGDQGVGSEDGEETEEEIPPQFDENGDPIPVPDEEQSTENEPVRRTYNDYGSGSS